MSQETLVLPIGLQRLFFNHLGRRVEVARGATKSDLDAADKLLLEQSLAANFYAHQIPALHAGSAEDFLASEVGRHDVIHHIDGRLGHFRATILPWMTSVMDLSPMSVLEIGAGTGASTVAFAEAADSVHAIDIDPGALRVARDRMRLQGLGNVTIEVRNGADLSRVRPDRFDLVIYIATLEHMTYAERLGSLGQAWGLLAVGGFMAVVDTPNRLWFFDGHTGMLPFFHWLPDELAIAYTQHSPRESLGHAFAQPGKSAATKLARWGRGVSYHEFQLALGTGAMEVVSSLQEHQRENDPGAKEWWEQSQGGRFQALLHEAGPDVPLPFLEDGLNLLIRKR